MSIPPTLLVGYDTLCLIVRMQVAWVVYVDFSGAGVRGGRCPGDVLDSSRLGRADCPWSSIVVVDGVALAPGPHNYRRAPSHRLPTDRPTADLRHSRVDA